ncbi:hypothetical protein KX729_09355 [Rhizobium sp. XQZ8]|uniref:hypothetical protein n=1 Tax=Rhizobium populisoli TaxID=2859785 RepID=UPI001CA495E4|nr:hypothetical protein [Rhizobium populisoli]MBW6421646.1 hypothetical protein [Rhizobium populisoli]
MTIADLFHYIGAIRLLALAYWLVFGPVLAWAWLRVADSIWWHWIKPKRVRRETDAEFDGVTIDL